MLRSLAWTFEAKAKTIGLEAKSKKVKKVKEREIS